MTIQISTAMQNSLVQYLRLILNLGLYSMLKNKYLNSYFNKFFKKFKISNFDVNEF